MSVLTSRLRSKFGDFGFCTDENQMTISVDQDVCREADDIEVAGELAFPPSAHEIHNLNWVQLRELIERVTCVIHIDSNNV
jgi:hypothetical protein